MQALSRLCPFRAIRIPMGCRGAELALGHGTGPCSLQPSKPEFQRPEQRGQIEIEINAHCWGPGFGHTCPWRESRCRGSKQRVVPCMVRPCGSLAPQWRVPLRGRIEVSPFRRRPWTVIGEHCQSIPSRPVLAGLAADEPILPIRRSDRLHTQVLSLTRAGCFHVPSAAVSTVARRTGFSYSGGT